MRGLIGIFALGFWALGVAQAIACTPRPQRQYPNQRADYLRFAEATVKEASFVEVVVVRSAPSVTAPEAWDRWFNVLGAPSFADKAQARAVYKAKRHKPVGVRFRLTVIDRLKGRAPATVLLDGGGTVPRQVQPRGVSEFRYVVRKGKRHPLIFLPPVDELDLPDALIARHSCMPSQLRLAIGQRYLIFRGGTDGF